jgi:hypothetical protein
MRFTEPLPSASVAKLNVIDGRRFGEFDRQAYSVTAATG